MKPKIIFKLCSLVACFALAACESEPTPAQLKIVDQLIQEQLAIPYDESNWKAPEDIETKQGISVEDTIKNYDEQYVEIQQFLKHLSQSAYAEKKAWAIKVLEMEIEAMKQSQNASREPSKELSELIRQRKAWLKTIKE